MAYDLTVFQQKTQASIAALPAAPAAKDLLLVAKAIEATTLPATVSDVVAAAAAGVTSINGAGNGALSAIATAQASATTAVGTARTGTLSDIETARQQAVSSVQNAGGGSSSAAGISYSPAGSLTATNVQAALGQLDTLKLAKASNLSDLADAKAARVNLGLDKAVSRGDAAYTILPGDRTILLTAPLTAPRTFTLPAATAMNPGASLRIADLVGGISIANTLTVAAVGSDTLNGATSFTFAAAYTDFQITTDGAGKWVFDVQGLARGGTGATTAAGARTNLGLGTAALATTGTAAGNVPVLDANSKLLASLLPSLAISDVFTVASQAAMLALTAERGDVAIRTDTSTAFILAVDDPTTLANWKALPLPAGVVMQVAGLSGPNIMASQLITALGLAIGTNVQAWDSDLDAIAALATTSYGRGLLTLANQAALATAAGTPSKAAGALLRALADDAAFITPKAMADAIAPVAWTYSATFTPDMSTFLSATMPLTGNLTLANPTNPKPGQAGEIVLTQDASGSRTVSYGSAWKFVGGTPTASTAANAVDVISYRVISSTLIICSFGKGVA